MFYNQYYNTVTFIRTKIKNKLYTFETDHYYHSETRK